LAKQKLSLPGILGTVYTVCTQARTAEKYRVKGVLAGAVLGL